MSERAKTALIGTALVVLAVWVRWQAWVINGGLEADYLAWSIKHYFGGITDHYLNGMHDLATFRWRDDSYMPGYSLFLLTLRLLGIENLQNMRLAQACLDSLALLPLYWLLLQMQVRPAFAWLGAAVYAVAPLWAFNGVMLLAEGLSPALFILFLAALAYARKHPQKLSWLAVGLVTGLAAFLRPDLMLLGAPLAIWTLLNAPAGARVLSAGLALFGLAFILVMQASFLYFVRGEFRVLPHGRYYNMWSGLAQQPNDFGYVLSDARASELLRSRGIDFNSADSEKFWKAEYQKAWREHRDHVLSTIAWRMKRMPFTNETPQLPGGYFPELQRYVCREGFFVFLAGLAVLLAARRGTDALLLMAPIVYALVSLGPLYYETRYVRYLSLSYLLAAPVVLEYLWRGLERFVPPRFAGAAAIVLVAGVALVGGARSLPVLAAEASDTRLDEQVRVAVSSGQKQEKFRLADVTWIKQVDGVQYETTPDGALRVVTSAGRYDYQIATVVPLEGVKGAEVTFDVEVLEGGVSPVLLEEDGSRFLAIQNYGKPGRYQGSLVVGRHRRKQVSFLLNNLRAEGGRSTFILHDLRIHAVP